MCALLQVAATKLKCCGESSGPLSVRPVISGIKVEPEEEEADWEAPCSVKQEVAPSCSTVQQEPVNHTLPDSSWVKQEPAADRECGPPAHEDG